jgi:hypothetical protein
MFKENTVYIYIWKTPEGVPFYVGLTKNKRRSNPLNAGGRNWLCKQKLAEIGADRVIIELRPVASVEEGTALECKLIAEIGRIQTGTGPLTNLREGGEGTHTPTPEHREKLRRAMLDPNHPVRSPEARSKQRDRMLSPDVRAKFSGDANPAKRPEVREKIKAKWADPEYRAMMAAKKVGKPIHSETTKRRLRERIADVPEMKPWGERNGKDPEFDAKRIAGIRAAQDRRREKMSDPVALAQRKERLKATMNSPEFQAKRAKWDTPEYRAKLSAARKAYWDKRKSGV